MELPRWGAARCRIMIEGLKPYAESGKLKPVTRTSQINIPWLTQLPAHWKVVRSKGLFMARTERARQDDEQLSATQAYGVIPQKEFERRVGRKVVQITQHLDKRAHVEPDDFVISMRSFQGGLERAWARGCIRSSYVVLRPSHEAQVGYFAHLFKSQDYIRALQATGNFIRDGQDLNYSNFSLVDLPLPPTDEQIAIARCLDHANRKIDRFISVKRKLIGLLNEQKQAIIHRAVTRGLDPNVALKPSGIAWLGDIPAHWEVLPARFLFRPVTRRDIQKGDPKMSVTQRLGLVPTDEMEENSTQARSFDHFQVCYPQDLVLNKYKAHLGVFCCAFQRGLITPNYTVFRPTRKLYTYFFDILFHTTMYRNEFSMIVHGVTAGMSPLYTQDFNRVPVVFPPHEEQKAILEGIDLITKPQNTAITRTEREIALMQEYRTRLTSDIVTGKLDVREAAANLPELGDDAATEPDVPVEFEELEAEEADE